MVLWTWVFPAVAILVKVFLPLLDHPLEEMAIIEAQDKAADRPARCANKCLRPRAHVLANTVEKSPKGRT